MIALLALSLFLQAPDQPAPKDQPAAAPEKEKPSDDFDLLPKEAAPDPAKERELEAQLSRRRQMLQLHQLGGMLTVATLGATVILGELNYIDKYGGGGDTGRFYQWHRWMAFTSAGIFAATAGLAIFAPSPIDRPFRVDTATLHKMSMAVASAGMVTQIVLGILTANKEGSASQRDYALAHQIVGFTTFGATAVGFGVLTF